MNYESFNKGRRMNNYSLCSRRLNDHFAQIHIEINFDTYQADLA